MSSQKPSEDYVTAKYQLRIFPTSEQLILINKYFGCNRYVWNWAIKFNTFMYQTTGKTVLGKSLNYYVKYLREEHPFLKEPDVTVLLTSLFDYSQSMKMFVKGEGGYPHHRKKRNSQTFRVNNYKGKNGKRNQDSVRFDGDMLKIGKLGWVKTKLNQPLPKGDIQDVTVKRTKSGKLIATVTIRKSEPVPQLPETGKEVGFDLGINDFAVLTDGTVISMPPFFKKNEKKLEKLHRQVSRTQRGSNNRKKALHKLALAYERYENQKTDFLHKLSLWLVREYDFIAAESLDIASMMLNGKGEHKKGERRKEREIHKSIKSLSWYSFLSMIKYKAEWYGKTFVQVDKFYPSSQLCHDCGHQNKAVKDLSVREWDCPKCSVHHHRDRNAANNILREAKRLACA